MYIVTHPFLLNFPCRFRLWSWSKEALFCFCPCWLSSLVLKSLFDALSSLAVSYSSIPISRKLSESVTLNDMIIHISKTYNKKWFLNPTSTWKSRFTNWWRSWNFHLKFSRPRFRFIFVSITAIWWRLWRLWMMMQRWYWIGCRNIWFLNWQWRIWSMWKRLSLWCRPFLRFNPSIYHGLYEMKINDKQLLNTFREIQWLQ